MERTEILFYHNNTRCHAMIVKELLGGETYIGKMDGYEIYQIDPHALFDQFGFVAVKEETK